jgi:hypothetical protein
MHRLVAYGIVSRLAEDKIPIPAYFGTQKDIMAVETGVESKMPLF